jgi:hypothetical protein
MGVPLIIEPRINPNAVAVLKHPARSTALFTEPSREAFVAAKVSTCGTGKHNLDQCEAFESAWRLRASATLQALAGDRTLILWASGPVCSGCLPEVFAHVLGEELRYHIAACTSCDKVGYHSSWVSFEFHADRFESLLRNRDLDLELTSLEGLFLDEELVGSVLTRPFLDIGLQWMIEQSAIGISSTSHFEGVYVFGLSREVDAALKRLSPKES